jgi:hypothetical protein
MKGIQNRFIKKFLAVTLATVFLLTACAGSSMSADMKAEAAAPQAMTNGSYYEEMGVTDMAPMEEVEMDMDSGVAGSGNLTEVKVERKIIKNADLSLETMEYDGAYAIIAEITEGFGGYIESSSIEGESLYNQQRGYRSDRWAQFTVRVPAEQLYNYIDALAEDFNITHKSESANDISDQYYDAAARLSNLQVQEKRLLELMEQAGQLADLLEIERELANVRYEIETITASLKRMDSKVSYSTVNISLQEVFEYQEKTTPPRTFADRIKDAFEGSADNFLDFCEELLIALIYAAPILLFFAVIILAVFFVIRLIRKAFRKKHPKADTTWQMPKRPEEKAEEKKEE